jgi:hypothetical protein
MQPDVIATGDRRKAARTYTAPLLVSAAPRLETYAVRSLMRRARISHSHALLVAELIGIPSLGRDD